MIIRGLLAPGSRIMEAELAERIGVSRTPVRGALQMLQKEGYVISASNGQRKTTLTVAPLTKQDALELFRVISRLEGLAARTVAEFDERRRDTMVEELMNVNNELKQLADASKNDPNLIFELDMRFHQIVADAGFGPRLRSLHASIKPQTERYMRLYAGAIVDKLTSSVREHLLIVHAIRIANPDAAERAVQLNWENGAQRLGQVIDELGERGAWNPIEQKRT